MKTLRKFLEAQKASTSPMVYEIVRARDDGDDFESCDDEDTDVRPVFGCACEDPLTVDDVCPSCVEYLREQDAPTEEKP